MVSVLAITALKPLASKEEWELERGAAYPSLVLLGNFPTVALGIAGGGVENEPAQTLSLQGRAFWEMWAGDLYQAFMYFRTPKPLHLDM